MPNLAEELLSTIEPKLSSLPRWRAAVTYKSGGTVFTDFEEFRDFGRWVECGPNFYSIAKIEIQLNIHLDVP
jgi:hypothetical protein